MGQCIGCKRSSKGLDPLPDAPIVGESPEREENGGSTSEARVIVQVDDVTIDSLTSQDNPQDDTRCEVWFRHSGEGKLDEIPPMPDTRMMTQSDIESEVRGHTITHMYIEKTIPDWLADTAPDVVSLKLVGIRDIETQIHRLAELVNLAKLNIACNKFTSHTLHPTVYKLKQLKVLHIGFCDLAELDDRLAELVNLESLNIAGNKFTSHTLHPAVYRLKQLKTLYIRNCGLTGLDDRLADLVNLEILYISHNKFTSHTLHPAVFKLRQLKVLDISYCGLTELDDGLAELANLEKLYIAGNKFTSHTLHHAVYRLRQLKVLVISDCDLTELDDRLAELVNLEELSIGGNKFTSHTLPPAVYKLRQLKTLYISNCGLTELDDRLAELVNLESLNIVLNKFTSHTLHPAVYRLRQLKVLDISSCGLTELDDRLAELVNLESLNIVLNKFTSHTLHPAVYRLRQLKVLDISSCGLTELDDRLAELVNLEKLDISGNTFTSQTLHPAVYKLRRLKVLDISLCGLTALDDRLSWLEELTELRCGNAPSSRSEGNSFTSFPKCILKMKNLQRLNISSLKHLTSLDPGLLNLTKLQSIDCDGCESLTSPPYAVCEQGLNAIKKFYTDLAKEAGIELPIISVVVIGNGMAGKTSLIRSLRDGKRVLSHRDPSAEHDDTTRVFEMNEIPIGQYKIKTFDFGGDKVYHITYHLTIRENYLPIVVVSMQQFQQNSLMFDTTEATRQLCLDFISHLYLSCPRLGPPILVLTHQDALSKDDFEACKAQLHDALQMLREELLEEQRTHSSNTGQFCKIEHFSSDLPMFAPQNIFIFSGDLHETDNIQRLLIVLTQRCQHYITVIPRLWELFAQFFEDNKEKLFIELDDILAMFPGDDNLIILRYMHNIGKILWFERHDELKNYVFHRISVLTEVIALLYNHQSDRDWERRMITVRGFRFENTWISREEYRALVEAFQTSGIIDSAVLNQLYSTESFPYHLVVAFLQTFYMICGPVSVPPRDGYIIPYFAQAPVCLDNPQAGNLRLRVDILFIALSPPLYVYLLLTVIFLNLHLNMGSEIKAAKNGAIVYHGRTTRYIIHDHSARNLQLIIDTPVDELASSWKALMETLDHLLYKLKSEQIKFDAARYICVFHCAHCQYIKDPTPGEEIAPSWYTTPAGNENRPIGERLRVNKVVNDVSCCKRTNTKPKTIPHILRFPCFVVSSEEKQRVRSYLSQLDSSMSTALVDDIVTVVNSQSADIILEPTPATAGYTEQGNQYKMTTTRGRALIISNEYEVRDSGNIPHSREGSEHDYKNMKRMLEKFGFVTSGDHKNYEAKNIVKAVHRETQLFNVDTGENVHKELGMFVLVIMSHGDEGCVLGSDDRRVKLTDIYNMLSGDNFPAMSGKPKLIVIQACSGVKSERTQPDFRPPSSIGGQTHITSSYTVDNNTSVDAGPTLSVDDLFILQSSFDSFLSYRDKNTGSPFIRALVTAFYKHARKFHVEELVKVIQTAVKKSGVGQVPISKSTSGIKKLYLQPGLNMTIDHSPHVQNAVYPKAPLIPHTRIHWEPSKSVETTVTVKKTNPDGTTFSEEETTPVLYEQWSLKKVTQRNQQP